MFRGHKHGILPILFVPFEHEAGQAENLQSSMQIYAKDLIITGSQDATAKTWSFETGECMKTFRGHSAAVLCLAADPLGKILFTGSSDNTIRSWDIYRGNELRVFDQHQAAIINLHVSKLRNGSERHSSTFSFLFAFISVR